MTNAVDESADYVIAVDFGTTMTAWAIRKTADKTPPYQVVAYSPCQDEEEKIYQKTPSDVHFFLKTKNEKLCHSNSQMGNKINKIFADQQYQYHHHFAFYKMSLYQYKPGTKKFMQFTQYPDYPKVNPQNSNEEFNLSDIYLVVVQHVKKSIEKYFENNKLIMNVDRIVWAITVPAISQQEHKNFMIQCFRNGMGQIGPQNKTIDINHIEIVLEPEGGFLYALNTKQEMLQKTTHDINMAIFDFGGGTYDMTVAKFKKNAAPQIVVSDFGEDIGGGDVDKEFMIDFERITEFSKLPKFSEKDRSIILFTILAKFQQEKHEHWGKAELDDYESFSIPIDPIWEHMSIQEKEKFIQGVTQRLAKLNADPQDPDISLLENDLIFTVDYAKQKYLFPTKTKLVAKTIQLIKFAHNEGCDINYGLMLGGFSACTPLLEEMKAQFALPVLTFSEPSLAIVKGATFFDRFNVTKKILKGTGLEVMIPLNQLSQESNDILQAPEWNKYVDNSKDQCAAGIFTLFKTNDIIKSDMFVERKFYFTTQEKISVVIHDFNLGSQVPEIYAHDAIITQKNLNPVTTESSSMFEVEIPQAHRNDKVFTMKFTLRKSGQDTLAQIKWENETQYTVENILKPGKVKDLDTRFKKAEAAPVHAIFVVDKSGSMDCSPIIQENQRDPLNILKNAVGDIFQNGIYTYIHNRIMKVGGIQKQDEYTIIIFDTAAKTICERQKIYDAKSVYDYESEVKDYGGTDFGPAMQQVLAEVTKGLQKSPKLSPQLLFLTDGDGSHPTDQVIQQTKAALKGNNFFINFGSEGGIGALAAKFGTKAIYKIEDAQQITDLFSKLSIPELIQKE